MITRIKIVFVACCVTVATGASHHSMGDEPAASHRWLGDDSATRCAISPDGTLLLRGSNLWELKTGRHVHVFPGVIVGDGFSPDGSRILTSDRVLGPPYRRYHVEAWVWDAKTGEKLATLKDNPYGVIAGAFSPDNRFLLTVPKTGLATLWDLESRKRPGQGEVRQDAGARLFARPKFAARVLGKYDAVEPHMIAFDTSGDMFYTGAAGMMAIRATGSLDRICEIKHQGAHFTSTAFVPGGKMFVAGHADGTVIVRGTANGKAITTIRAHGKWVSDTIVSNDGKRLATASTNHPNEWKADWSASPHRQAKLWDPATGRLIREFVHAGPVTEVQMSDDGSRLLTVWKRPMACKNTNSADSDHTVSVWDTDSGAELLRVELTKNWTTALLSRNGDRVFTEGPEMRLWDARMGQLIREYPKAK